MTIGSSRATTFSFPWIAAGAAETYSRESPADACNVHVLRSGSRRQSEYASTASVD